MSRIEADREDLMRDATALVRRIEFSVPDFVEPLTAGFRRHGGLSLYVGQNSVFHFDEDCRLRRAFRDGVLYRTQGETLAALTRDRRKTATILVRRDLTGPELNDFLNDMKAVIRKVRSAITENRVEVLRRIPQNDANILTEIHDVLFNVSAAKTVLAPPIPGKP